MCQHVRSSIDHTDGYDNIGRAELVSRV